MLRVKKLTREEIKALPALQDGCLCSEEVVVRIGCGGLSLGYVSLEPAQWKSFPPRLPLPLEEMSFLLSTSVYASFYDNRFCALAAVRHEENGWAEILDLRVDTRFRRLGIGTSLLDACAGFTLCRGLPGMLITVSDRNPVACQFLEASGFQVQGMDRFRFSRLPGETEKPLLQRACALTLYKTLERG